MKKANELKQFLTKHVEFLRQNPNNWQFSVTHGQVTALATTSLSYDYQYQVTLAISSFQPALNTLLTPLITWLFYHQPELFDDGQLRDDVLTFTMNENGVADSLNLTLTLAMSERVCVQYDAQNHTLSADYFTEKPQDPFDMPAENDILTALSCQDLSYK